MTRALFIAVVLAACSGPEVLVRRRAAQDFACPQADVSVEARGARESGGPVYVARGCGWSVVYGVGGEWFSSWASPCAPVLVRGQVLLDDVFARGPEALCHAVIADAGASPPVADPRATMRQLEPPSAPADAAR